MPELPEVETVARQLAPMVRERRLRRVRILDQLLRSGRCPPYSGRLIANVFRFGKQVLFELDRSERDDAVLYLAIHLRMTGRLLHVDRRPRCRSHLRAVLELDRGAVLFIDPRRFGTLRWLRTPEQAAPGAIEPLGPCFTAERLAEELGRSRPPIKPWLLRQDRLVGLGNIYASEILHEARLSPLRATNTLRPAEITRLHRATRAVLERAIEHCGTTFSDFQDARGVTGSYQRFLAVYGREGEPCLRCAGPIVRLVQQQRSTFFCPRCVQTPRRHRKSGRPQKRSEPAAQTGSLCH
ncbi:MAG: bifunctional DNA-formamidopyrimidine glycosylase/DNA-(apurinic or apyrimidinic site) lyase [Acidobacteriota bacterium]|nr:MAG: bifunctional DNA-formamidopyrimidine glycosylase/DNA-(apurinic or apyrimidinic site) lyase [Acidobacteriota bacterium]